MLAALLASALLAAGCSGTTSALRGVGAPEANVAAAAFPRDTEAQTSAETLASDRDPDVLFETAAPQYTRTEPQAYAGSEQSLFVTGTDESDEESEMVAEVPPMPEMGTSREGTVEELRAKGNAVGKNKPSAFTTRQATARPMSKKRLAKAKADLNAAVAANQAGVSDAEAEAVEQRRKLLRQQAARHYKDALSTIEN